MQSFILWSYIPMIIQVKLPRGHLYITLLLMTWYMSTKPPSYPTRKVCCIAIADACTLPIKYGFKPKLKPKLRFKPKLIWTIRF